jgi:hypothetical protein
MTYLIKPAIWANTAFSGVTETVIPVCPWFRSAVGVSKPLRKIRLLQHSLSTVTSDFTFLAVIPHYIALKWKYKFRFCADCYFTIWKNKMCIFKSYRNHFATIQYIPLNNTRTKMCLRSNSHRIQFMMASVHMETSLFPALLASTSFTRKFTSRMWRRKLFNE